MNFFSNKFERLLKSFDKRYTSYVETRLNNAPPKDTPLGFKFLGNEAMEKGYFEPDETALLSKLLTKVDHFVNVGANIGYYCCLALSKNIPVTAFEPEQKNLKLLIKNIRANNWSERIEIHPVALSDKIGIVDIYGSGTGASLLRGWANTPTSLVTSIPASTLDICIGGRLQQLKSLILIDIEGVEYLALKGGQGIIEQKLKPIWIVEICSYQHQPAGVPINPNLLATFSLFWNAGYESYTVSNPPRPVTRSEIVAIADGGQDTIRIHNFIFIDRTERADEIFNSHS